MVEFIVSPHQVREDALQRLVGRGELEDPDTVVAGQLREPDREGAEVGDRDVHAALRAQRDGDHGGLGDEGAGQGAVVVADHDVLHRTVGHQPADLSEVAGRGVPAGHHDLDLPGDLLDLLEDVGGEEDGAPLGAHLPQQVPSGAGAGAGRRR